MKNTMIMGLVVLTALFFSSCSKDEVSNVNSKDSGAIGFDPSTGKTRAIIMGISDLEANGFGVYATKGTAATEFIANRNYVYSGGAWGWENAPIKWPATDAEYPVSFYAYYPNTSASLSTSLTADYTIEAAPVDQTDFLAANHTGVVSRPASGNVTLAFKHILSKVDFKVVTGANVTVEVQSIAVRKVGSTGSFDFSGLSWATTPTSGNISHSYMTAQSPASISINKFVGATTAESVTGSSNSLMLMPQDLSGRGWNKSKEGLNEDSCYIEVVYRVYETAAPHKDIVGYSDATQHPDYATLGNGATGPLFVKVGFTLSTNWLMSKAYTYTIHLGTPDGSGGNLVEETFVDKEGENTGLPVVDPETGGGIDVPEVIFPDKPIGFIVSVTDWDAAINENIQ